MGQSSSNSDPKSTHVSSVSVTKATDGWDTEEWGSLEEEPVSCNFILFYLICRLSKRNDIKMYKNSNILFNFYIGRIYNVYIIHLAAVAD